MTRSRWWRQEWSRIQRDVWGRLTPRVTEGDAVDAYVRTAPAPQNAIDIFAGEWSSRFPAPYDEATGAIATLFDDPRLTEALAMLGSVEGKRILELGPLEGAHTYMLDRAGAADILAVEGNTRAYLKCLVVKEIFGIRSSRFVCGDFQEYLRQTPGRVDLALASGVLYHMMAPAELLGRLSAIAGAIYLWTHYYDEGILSQNPALVHRIVPPETAEFRGFTHVVYPFHYGDALQRKTYCGGNERQSRWMSRAGILEALVHFGYTRVRPFYEQPRHAHGPAFCVLAER